MAEEDSQDDSQKTEEPTQKRLDEARKRGQVIQSREVTNFIMMLAFTAVLLALLPFMMRETMNGLPPFIHSPEDYPMQGRALRDLMLELGLLTAIVLSGPVLLTFIAAFVGNILTHGWIVSAESLKPKLNKVSPLAGMKRLFSMKSLMEFIKGIIKISVIGFAGWYALNPYIPRLEIMPGMEIAEMDHLAYTILFRLMITLCVAIAFMAVMDYAYQRHDYYKGLRMSRQDLKDEFKQHEGDPHIKGKLKALRREKASRRMMANVPQADVVVTNPTHYAVALKYETGKMSAPLCLAKGMDQVALKIRELAKENKIPIVENPPLARALYADVELDQEVPVQHYKAVAEVISYVFQLKKPKKPVKPAQPPAPPPPTAP